MTLAGGGETVFGETNPRQKSEREEKPSQNMR
jgi:hypothetical protein